MAFELPPAPGTSGIDATLGAILAAADSLDRFAAVNREQVASNVAFQAALAEQNTNLTTSADNAVQVATGLRGLVPAAPQAALFGGGLVGKVIAGGKFAGSFANLLAALEALTAHVRDLAAGVGK